MKKILFVILYWNCVVLSQAQEKSLGENTAKVEALAFKLKVEQMRREYQKAKANYKPSDYSKTPTEDLLDRSLSYGLERTTAGSYPYVMAELKKRPKEFEIAIRKKASRSINKLYRGSFIHELTLLPEYAVFISKDFQLEIAKITLFREEYNDIESYAFPFDYLFNILTKSRHDETAILDRLIEEGRVIKGSKFDKKWRALLQKKIEKNESENFEFRDKLQPFKEGHVNLEKDENNKPKEISDSPATQSENNTIPHNQLEADSNKPRRIDKESRLPWIIAGLIALSLAGAFFIKSRISS